MWARRADAAAEIAHPHGAVIAGSVEELLSGVDAVSFAVPPGIQAPIALDAVRAGKHVILEKPIASTVDEAERLAAAVAEAGVASMVVLTLRFAPETVAWLDELHRLGGWRGGGARWLSGALLDGMYAGSRWRHVEGALADLGPHVFDLLDAALGEITEVVSAHRTEPDLWHVVLRHASGASSTASMSLRLPLQPGVTDIAVYGEHGYREFARGSTSALDSFAALLDDLTGMVHTGQTEHRCDIRRGLHLQRLIHAAATKIST